MTFTSLFFILIIFPFFLIFSLFDHSAEYKNMILIITSLLFFAWGKPIICLVMLLSFVLDFILGILCQKKYPRSIKIIALLADLIFNIGFYFAVNFTDFSQNFKTGSNIDLIFPLFSAIYFARGFLYVYSIFCDDTKAEKNIFCLMTYTINFQLLNPAMFIEYKDIAPQIRQRKTDISRIKQGIFVIIFGLCKCVILANIMQIVYSYAKDGYILDMLIKSLAMFAGIYFYLSGSADISSGIGLTTGFKYSKTFNTLKKIPKTIFCFFAMLFIFIQDNFFDKYINSLKSCFVYHNIISAKMLNGIKLNLLICLFIIIYFIAYGKIKRLDFFEKLENKSEKTFAISKIIQIIAMVILFFVCIVIMSQGGILA